MKTPGRFGLERLRGAVRVAWSGLYVLVTRNPGLKLISLVLAVALWSFVNVGERDAEEPLQVPLELRNIPANLVITSPRLDFVDIRVIGPRTLLGRIDRGRLSLSLDLDGVRPGPAVFRVGPEAFNLPRGVRITRINPSQITLELERLGRKAVPVHLRLAGELGEDFRLAESAVVPEAIEVSGPASDVREVAEVVTEPLDLSEATAGSLQKDLVLEPTGEYLTYSVPQVRARLLVEDVPVTRAFEDVAVQLVDGEAGMRVVPATVTANVRGPRRLVRFLTVDELAVIVDPAARPEDGSPVVPEVKLPDNIELVSLDPARVQIELPPDVAEQTPAAEETVDEEQTPETPETKPAEVAEPAPE